MGAKQCYTNVDVSELGGKKHRNGLCVASRHDAACRGLAMRVNGTCKKGNAQPVKQRDVRSTLVVAIKIRSPKLFNKRLGLMKDAIS